MVRTSGTSQVCLVHLVSLMQPNKPDRPNRPNLQDRLADFFSILLGAHPSGELGKELPREIAGIGWVDDILAAKIIVEDSAIGGFVDVGQSEIHVVAFDGAGHAADEDHGAIWLLPLDDPDVRQRVVHLAIPVVVPCIVEKDEIAWVDSRSLVERALLAYMCMDKVDAVGVRVAGSTAIIEIDAVFEKNRAGYSGTVIGDAAAVHFNGAGSDELSRGADNGGSMWCGFRPLAAALLVWGDCLRAISCRAGTAD